MNFRVEREKKMSAHDWLSPWRYRTDRATSRDAEQGTEDAQSHPACLPGAFPRGQMHFARIPQSIEARGSVTGVAKGKVAFLSPGGLDAAAYKQVCGKHPEDRCALTTDRSNASSSLRATVSGFKQCVSERCQRLSMSAS